MPSKKVTPVITTIALLAAAMLLGFAAGATAQSPGLDQYTESIPGAGGNHTTDKGDKGGGSGGSNGGGGSSYSSGPTVGSSQLDALRSQGSEGERAAAALEATSGSSNSKGSKGSNGDSKGDGRSDKKSFDSSEAEGKTPVEAVLSSMFGGTGIVLPLIMLAVLVGGLAIAARKRAASIDD